MTKGKRKTKGVHKNKPPEVDLMSNKTDEMELQNVKREPPDIVVCELNCSKCQKVKTHIDTLSKYADSFVNSVLAEGKSIRQLEELLNTE